MANECKMEFYFTRAEIEKLLVANPKAKGIIITHQIVQEKPKGSLKLVNIARISARVDPAPKKKTSSKLMGDPEDLPTQGCPYPPGCTQG